MSDCDDRCDYDGTAGHWDAKTDVSELSPCTNIHLLSLIHLVVEQNHQLLHHNHPLLHHNHVIWGYSHHFLHDKD